MKSKYPNEIDSPKELPVVRDNITEITSDIINSLRSAIIQIEKTLGINPQGDIGNTLSERLSMSIDSSGNLKKEALDSIGVIHGPIMNDQISDIASIEEKKLKLEFPTKVLGSQLSILNSTINELASKINDLSAIISSHTNPNSLNRHSAVSINVSSVDKSTSQIGIKSLQSDNLQNIIKEISDSHFNYDGSSISSDNNSHSAEQIYFNNKNVSASINSSSVQSAIEEVAFGNESAIINSNLYLTKNGIARFGKVNDEFGNSLEGEILLPSSTISFSQSKNSTFTITFDSSPAYYKEIQRFDIITISNSLLDADNGRYYISDITTDGTGNILAAVVFGKRASSSMGVAVATITKNNFQNLNSNALNSTVRVRNGFSNTPDIIISNPNSATITSIGLRPDLLTASNDSFQLTIDDYDPITISCFDSSVANQTVDSIVNKVNETLASKNCPVFAYKLRTTFSYEISLSHIVPNFSSDIKERKIKISDSVVNNGTSELGLSTVKDTNVYGTYGNSTFINGKLFKSFQNIVQFSKEEVYFGSGSPNIQSFNIDFLQQNIRIGDILVVTGSSEAADDGAFSITSITSNRIGLDYISGYFFTGTLGTTSSVLIIRSSAAVSELNFEEVDSTSGLMLIDVFASSDYNIFYSKRLEISNVIDSSGFFASVVDVSKDFILSGEKYYLRITTGSVAYLEDDFGNVGETVYVGNTVSSVTDSVFHIRSPSGLSFVKIRVLASANPSTNLSCTLFGGKEVSRDNLILSRVLFSNSTGRVFGNAGSGGIPSIIDKRNFGTIDVEQICPSFIEKTIEGPRNDLRASGVVSGCEVALIGTGTDSVGSYVEITVGAGVCIASGRRIEFSGISMFKARVASSSYICINELGMLEVSPEVNGITTMVKVSPFLNREVVHIGYLYYNTNFSLQDIRFFINKLDNKLSHNIVVAKSTDIGHFTDIQKAVDYCSIFYQINYGRDSDSYNYSPSVLIREGEYEINSPIVIEHDITISGVGKNTVLKRGSAITDCSAFSPNPDPRTAIFMIGIGPGVSRSYSTDDLYSDFNFGVTIKDLTYYSPTLTTNSKTAFCFFQGEEIASETSASFTLSGISATGAPERLTDDSICEYFLFVGRISATNGETMGFPPEISKIFVTSNFIKRMGAHNNGWSGTDPADVSNFAIELALFYSYINPPIHNIVFNINDIICTSNICVGIAPTVPTEYSRIIRNSFAASVTRNASSIIEESNSVRTGV